MRLFVPETPLVVAKCGARLEDRINTMKPELKDCGHHCH